MDAPRDIIGDTTMKKPIQMDSSPIKEETLDREYLKEILDYDSETGSFKWKKVQGRPNCFKDQEAGSLPSFRLYYYRNRRYILFLHTI